MCAEEGKTPKVLSETEKIILTGRIYPAIQSCVRNRYYILLGIFAYYSFIFTNRNFQEQIRISNINLLLSIIFTIMIIHNLINYFLNNKDQRKFEEGIEFNWKKITTYPFPLMEILFFVTTFVLILGAYLYSPISNNSIENNFPTIAFSETTRIEKDTIINNLTRILSSILTPLIAITTTLIIVYQYRLEKQRLRLNLYDKRYPVFLATMEYITFANQNANITNEAINKFLRNSRDFEFLFGNDVSGYLEVLYQKGLDFELKEKLLKNELDKDKKEKLAKQSRELLDWFISQYAVSKKLFGKYLAINKK